MLKRIARLIDGNTPKNYATFEILTEFFMDTFYWVTYRILLIFALDTWGLFFAVKGIHMLNIFMIYFAVFFMILRVVKLSNQNNIPTFLIIFNFYKYVILH